MSRQKRIEANPEIEKIVEEEFAAAHTPEEWVAIDVRIEAYNLLDKEEQQARDYEMWEIVEALNSPGGRIIARFEAMGVECPADDALTVCAAVPITDDFTADFLPSRRCAQRWIDFGSAYLAND